MRRRAITTQVWNHAVWIARADVPTPGGDLVGGYLLDATLIGNTIWAVGVTGQNLDQSIVERLPR